jgi:hypothetical protein
MRNHGDTFLKNLDGLTANAPKEIKGLRFSKAGLGAALRTK